MAINEAAPLADPLVDKHDVYFRTDHLKTDLGGRTARGGAVTVVSQALKFLISMVGTVVLARLLTPQDYGLIGMVAVVIGFVSMFKDLGLSTATIQRPEITNAQISTLFWINLALSVGVMLVAAAIAPAIARFYHEPRLVLITRLWLRISAWWPNRATRSVAAPANALYCTGRSRSVFDCRQCGHGDRDG